MSNHECEELSTCCGKERHEHVDDFCGSCNEWAQFECEECDKEQSPPTDRTIQMPTRRVRIKTTGERMTEDIDNAMQSTGRAKPDKEQKARIELTVSEGCTTNELLGFCHNMLDLPISLRTAQRYMEKYGGDRLDIDQPVDWTNLDGMINAGVIQNTIPTLNKVNTWVQSKFGTTDPKWESTYRDLRWQSYVIASAPITKRMDIWAMGQLLSITARLALYQGEEMAVVGRPIIMWLQYAPFESKEADTRYKKAVEEGLIPHLMDGLKFFLAHDDRSGEDGVIKTKTSMAMAMFTNDVDAPLITRDESSYPHKLHVSPNPYVPPADRLEQLPTDRTIQIGGSYGY